MGDGVSRASASSPPPHASETAPRSVQELDVEIARRERQLHELAAAKKRSELVLRDIRATHERLAARIADLERRVGEESQRLQVQAAERERLCEARARIQRKATDIAYQLQREALAEAQGNGEQAQQQQGAGPGAVAGAATARAHPRVPMGVEIGFETLNNFYVGFSENVSEGGLFVATYETLPVGTRFAVEFRLPQTERPIRCPVEVAWVNEAFDAPEHKTGAQPGMGLRFLGLVEEDRRAVEGFAAERQPMFFPEAAELY